MKDKQQIIHIHGGEIFEKYEEYITFIKNKEYSPYNNDSSLRWSKNYYTFLDSQKYDVLRPSMPCAMNSKYKEWKIWFEKLIPFLRKNVILIGHSLGGLFVAKYLSENILPVKIKQLHLVAPVFGLNNDLGDFKIKEFPKDFFKNEINEIHIYHSEDDSMVQLSDSEKYHSFLPKSYFHRFTNRGHFLDKTFPELFENIKNPNK